MPGKPYVECTILTSEFEKYDLAQFVIIEIEIHPISMVVIDRRNVAGVTLSPTRGSRTRSPLRKPQLAHGTILPPFLILTPMYPEISQ